MISIMQPAIKKEVICDALEGETYCE